MSCVDDLFKLKSENKTQVAVLIDPDKASPQSLISRMKFADEIGAAFTFLGGSFVSDYRLSEIVLNLKDYSNLPIVLFPGTTLQLVPEADAVLYLSLISGRNPEYLIGRHVESAPILQKLSLEIIPTGYMLIDGEKPTSVLYISNTMPIPNNKYDIAAYTALAGEYLGLKCVYMDAGSGAAISISPAMVSTVSKITTIPLIVGGGIRNTDQISSLAENGANLIVLGSVIEETIPNDLFKDSLKRIISNY